jgi:Ribbon-helix-helix protein, copG family
MKTAGRPKFEEGCKRTTMYLTDSSLNVASELAEKLRTSKSEVFRQAVLNYYQSLVVKV